MKHDSALLQDDDRHAVCDDHARADDRHAGEKNSMNRYFGTPIRQNFFDSKPRSARHPIQHHRGGYCHDVIGDEFRTSCRIHW